MSGSKRLLANRDRGARLARCRELLCAAPVEERRETGRMHPLDDLRRPNVGELLARTYTAEWPDTS